MFGFIRKKQPRLKQIVDKLIDSELIAPKGYYRLVEAVRFGVLLPESTKGNPDIYDQVEESLHGHYRPSRFKNGEPVLGKDVRKEILEAVCSYTHDGGDHPASYTLEGDSISISGRVVMPSTFGELKSHHIPNANLELEHHPEHADKPCVIELVYDFRLQPAPA